jgi:hypothetical protein
MKKYPIWIWIFIFFLLFSLSSYFLFIAPQARLNAQTTTMTVFNWTHSCENLSTWTNTENRWEVRTDGKAAVNASYWGQQRRRIKSDGAAFVLNADKIVKQYTNGFQAILCSPSIPLNGYTGNKLYFSATMYARFLQTNTAKIEVSFNNSSMWVAISPNNLGLVSNYETPRYYRCILPITLPSNSTSIRFRFHFNGKYYFWIVDDIRLSSAYPSETLPEAALGTYLHQNNIPYSVDSLGHAFAKDEIVVKYNKTITPTERTNARTKFGVNCYTSCVCDTIERWKLVYPIFSENPTDTIVNIGIEQNVLGASSTTKVQSSEPNYYAYNELWNDSSLCTLPNTCENMEAPEAAASNPAALKIAILDTGLDYQNPFFENHIWQNGSTTNANCVQDDYIGYNFTCATCENTISNNPNDDHSHGTHVAGILKRSLLEIGESTCNDYKLMPIKTHDKYGIGTLFSTTCGIYYAVDHGAKFINCSWGYYAKDENSSPIMRQAIQYAKAKNAALICSAGNQGQNINTPHLHLPSSFNLSNVVGVAATDSTYTSLLAISNYSSVYVDVATRGENVYSNLICGQMDYKTGTSMAAPAITAVLAHLHCTNSNFRVESTTLINLSSNNCNLVIPATMPVSTNGYIPIPLQPDCVQ